MIVAADTSSLNYLVLIHQIDLLPRLYGRVFIPRAVFRELSAAKAPAAVKQWIESGPEWIDVRDVVSRGVSIANLGIGEREGIALAEDLRADYIVLDDMAARRAAEARNLAVIGILGILINASGNGWINLREALENLRNTNFRTTEELLASILEQYKK